MRITLYGAAGDVTGSSYHVQTSQAQVLVDFGVFQGGKSAELKNKKLPPFNVRKIDAIALTHAHLDHTGRLPLLTRAGYSGPIYATPATMDVVGLVLKDSLKVQTFDLERINRKRERQGLAPERPLYSEEDVDNVLRLLTPIGYNEPIQIADGITLRALEAGHILGSVSLELTLKEGETQKSVVFSGDLGPQHMAILRDPVPFTQADMVFMESTYGNRDHRSLEDTFREGREIIRYAVEHKGKILVPAFAIGRTQQLLYYLAAGVRNESFPEFPVYLDSPMGIEATKIYTKHTELYDDEALEMLKAGDIQGDLSRVRICETAAESMALNDVKGPCMIIAGAGMCNAGRILHHLKHNLFRPETSVIVAGYQGEGSLGRKLIEGAKKVRIFGEDVVVKAQIHSLGGLSAHAGQTDLLRWFSTVAPSRPQLVLSHGEDRARLPLAGIIKERFGIEAILPAKIGDTVEITN